MLPSRCGADGGSSLDITGADMLKGLIVELKDEGIDIYMAEVHATVREFGERMELLEIIGEDHIFPTVDTAVRFIESSDRSDQANLDGSR
jgi:SulP family sulfate permease